MKNSALLAGALMFASSRSSGDRAGSTRSAVGDVARTGVGALCLFQAAALGQLRTRECTAGLKRDTERRRGDC
jgi:hypothetical protein